MTDFEKIMQFLNARFPNESTQPFFILEHKGPDIKLVFPQADVWYDTIFTFTADGKLIDINGVSAGVSEEVSEEDSED